MDDIKNTITNITKNITKTSSELLKTTKISVNISNEEANLKNIYIEVGKKVQEIYAYGGTLGKYFDEKYIEITQAEDKIKDLKNQLDQSKGVRTCPSCGKTAPKTSEFCPKCGENMDGVVKPTTDYNGFDNPIQNDNDSLNKDRVNENKQQNPNEKKQVGKKCSVCSYINQIDEKFCISCGRML